MFSLSGLLYWWSKLSYKSTATYRNGSNQITLNRELYNFPLEGILAKIVGFYFNNGYYKNIIINRISYRGVKEQQRTLASRMSSSEGWKKGIFWSKGCELQLGQVRKTGTHTGYTKIFFTSYTIKTCAPLPSPYQRAARGDFTMSESPWSIISTKHTC